MADWTRTALTRDLGIDYPLVQGPFGGGTSTVALAAAVSQAGGLGSYGANHLHPEELDRTLTALAAATSRPFNVNLWVPLPGEPRTLTAAAHTRGAAALAPWFERLGVDLPTHTPPRPPVFEEQVEVLLAHRPAVFSFVFGIPNPAILAQCARLGIYTIGAATHLDEAVALQEAGVDAVVASGYEAGGHRPAFLRPATDTVATGPLTAQLTRALSLPVIAAGGIADGRGIASALLLGAAGVQLGTAFLATEQSGAPAAHKQVLRSPRARHTTLTRAFSGRLARGVRNDFLDAHEGDTTTPPYPQQLWLTAPLKAAAARLGDPEALALWSGQSASLVPGHTDAGQMLRHLAEDTTQVVEAFAR